MFASFISVNNEFVIMKFLGICLSAIVLSCNGKELASFIHKCKRDYPEVNKCLMQRMEDLKPYLSKGIPEMGLPPIEPLCVPKIEINTRNQSSGGLELLLTDIVIEGANTYEVKYVDFNLENHTIDINMHIPNLRLRSTYSINGKLLILYLTSSGPAEANITNINSTIHCTAVIMEKDGKQYLTLSNYTGSVDYAKPSMHFGNLFKGNDELTEQTNKVINDNINDIGTDFKPLLRGTIRSFIAATIAKVFKAYSLEELFN